MGEKFMDVGVVCVPAAFLYENSETMCISDEVLSGWPVEVLRRYGNFFEIVTHYGYRGWIAGSALRKILPEEYAWWGFWGSRAKASGNCYVPDGEHLEPAILCKGVTDILKEPKVQACILCTLFLGSTVTAVGNPQEGWQKVKTAGGICGFVPSCSLLRLGDLEQVKISGEAFGYLSFHSPLCQRALQKLATEPMPQMESQLRSAILTYAISFLGTQYRWGGKSHAGIDCSGLAFMSYYMCGIQIYRDAAIVGGFPVREIPCSKIKPADLLYFPGHMALYLGDGRYIHATGNPASFGCTINSLHDKAPDYRKDLAENLSAAGSVFPSPCL